MTPERTMPKPPPTPNTDDRRPIPTCTRSGGASRGMIASEGGKPAPPVPATARKPISDQRSQAKAAPALPTRKSPRLTTSMRSLPNWSPSLPRIGVVTAAVTRNAVSTHVTHAVVPPSSRWNVPSAGKTIVCWKANAVPASVRMARVTLWCWRAGSTAREPSGRPALRAPFLDRDVANVLRDEPAVALGVGGAVHAVAVGPVLGLALQLRARLLGPCVVGIDVVDVDVDQHRDAAELLGVAVVVS